MTRRHLVLGLAAAPTVWALRRVLRNEFVLTNEAEQVVRDLTVDIGGQEFRYDRLRPDEVVSGRFVAPDDEANFAVRGRYADGRAFAGTTGYVAWEDVGRTFRLVVLADGLTTR
ncbi:hypothetical protein J0H58_09095 [bacterium]|nr:hypothetical protein [bacterium]